jgi:hypothetical protein
VSHPTRTILSFLGLAAALICYALFVYYPAIPRTIVGWLGLLFVGVPLLFLFEWLGEKTLGSPFFSRLPSAARIALGVPVFIILMVVVIWLASIASSFIAQ